MDKTLKLIKNNDGKDWTDLQWIEEFYWFLQGEKPKSVLCRKLNLSQSEAFTIIWYLQEHFPILPDNIERCDECGDLYDMDTEGYHSELQAKNFCECSADGEYYKDDKFAGNLNNKDHATTGH